MDYTFAMRTFCLLIAWATSAIADPVPPGNVAIAADAPLYPSAAAARAHVQDPPTTGTPIAMRLIADRGDVVELSTGHAADCLGDFFHPYALRVFAPKAALIARAAAAVTKSFDDGTAVVIDRGAAVRAGKPVDPVLAATGVAPIARLTLAAPPKLKPVALPRVTGERMVCDPLMTESEWRQRQQDFRRARKPGDVIDRWSPEIVPWCTLTNGLTMGSEPPKPPPTVGGTAMPWPFDRSRTAVYRSRAGFLADAEVTCGRVRVMAEEAALVRPGGTGTAGGFRAPWTPRPGAVVVWPDGSPAGKYEGPWHHVDRDVVEQGDLICVALDPVTERVCHRRGDVDH
jgi:hypothetical protein